MIRSGFALAVALQCVAGADNKIIGVAPNDLAKYQPDADGYFSCLSDPSIKIPFDRVNDDYCDCPDGSDEPGTSACRNGQFWCANVGHYGQYISSRLVNDGACDYDVCCDGSDEEPGLCPDRCKEVHEKFITRQKELRAIYEAGKAIRDKMVAESEEKRQQWESAVADLSRELDEVRRYLEQSEKELAQFEEEDADFGTDADSESLNNLASAKNSFTKRHEQVNNLYNQALALETAYNSLSDAFAKMADSYNPNFNDPAVKEAIKTWRETSEDKKYGLSPPVDNLDEDLALLSNVKVSSAEEQSGETNFYYKLANLLHLSSPLDNLRSILEDWDLDFIGPPSSGWSGSRGNSLVSPRVEASRKAVQNFKNQLSGITKSLQDKEALLSFPWGPDGVGRALESTCVSKSIGEYTYEVCFTGEITQKGSQRNSLGKSRGFEIEGDHLKIEFENGDQCWNGPRRSARAVIKCGSENAILTIEEPNKCAYVLELLSPAACSGAAGVYAVEGVEAHDEL